jgi:hypothetical protein|tara:strand:+ start:208 stop:921 length:714 start_codon:yes stop_codon:yes gene_type:complete
MSNKVSQSNSLLLNVACNIIIPTLILINLSTSEYLGTKLAIAVALTFPIIYGLKDFIMIKKLNAFSVLGFISILLTGGVSLLELNPIYIAIKEAAIPAIFGIATLVSLKTPYPLVKTFLYNDKIMQTKRISTIIKNKGSAKCLEVCLANASLIVASSFFLSSLLNYILAVSIITSQPGTVEFNEQLGVMTALSFPVIAIPSMLILLGALFYLFRGIKKLTGLQLEEIIQHNESKQKG